MRIADHAIQQTTAPADWADRTRRVLTRDLLIRARHAQPTEQRKVEPIDVGVDYIEILCSPRNRFQQ